MKSALEIESKLELSKSSFEHLLSQGHIHQASDQLNIYYDNNWRLASNGCTFRMRFTPNKPPLITLKLALHSSDGHRIARELETTLEKAFLKRSHCRNPIRQIDTRNELAEGFRDELISGGINMLFRVGSMRTKRYLVQFASVGFAELDWVRLPNGEDFFEVEIETPDDESRHRLITHIRRNVPDCQPSTLSKFERFHRALLSRNTSRCALSATARNSIYTTS